MKEVRQKIQWKRAKSGVLEVDSRRSWMELPGRMKRPQKRFMEVVCSHAECFVMTEDARAIEDAAVRWRQVIFCGNPLDNSQK